MRKFYISLAAAFVAAAGFASVPHAAPGRITASGENFSEEFSAKSRHTAEVASFSSHNRLNNTVAVKNDAAEEQWESVGNGSFFEGIILPIYGSSVTPEYAVEISRSTSTEGLYRISNPYKSLAETYPSIFSYDETSAEAIYLQVVGENKFYVKSFSTGLIDLEDNAPILISSQAENLIKSNDLSTVLSVVPGAFGSFTEGVFKFDDPTFTLNSNTYYDLLVSIAGTNYRGNTNNGFKILLPGAVDKDYSVSISHASCADNNSLKFRISLGADVENYKLFIVSGEYPASGTYYDVVAKNGQAFTSTQTAISYNAPETAKAGIYTIYAVTVDAENNTLAGARSLFYVLRDNQEEWEAIEGKAKYVDDIVASIYNNHTDEEKEVAIEVNKEIPGYYRLVNPYAEPYKYVSHNVHTGTHNHYIYINAANPSQVYIEESPIGFEYGDGAMAVVSLAYNQLASGTDASEITSWGTLKEDVITFPANSLYARELNYNNATWYPVNTNGAFRITLPKTGGIDGIDNDSDETPAEYFNLQGVKVSNPTSGLYIVRKGNQISKQIIR